MKTHPKINKSGCICIRGWIWICICKCICNRRLTKLVERCTGSWEVGKLNGKTCRQWRAAKQTRPKKEAVGKKAERKDAVKVGFRGSGDPEIEATPPQGKHMSTIRKISQSIWRVTPMKVIILCSPTEAY